MSRFNHLLQSHFHGCDLLGTMHDDYRNRDLKVYAIPGIDETNLVGISDGSTAWVSSRNHSLYKMKPADKPKARTRHVLTIPRKIERRTLNHV